MLSAQRLFFLYTLSGSYCQNTYWPVKPEVWPVKPGQYRVSIGGDWGPVKPGPYKSGVWPGQCVRMRKSRALNARCSVLNAQRLSFSGRYFQ